MFASTYSALGENFQTSYEAGNYPSAIKELRSDPRPGSAQWNYNLGCAYYQNQELGKATAYFEAAHWIQPHLPDLAFNRDLARQELKQKLGTDSLNRSENWLSPAEDILREVSWLNLAGWGLWWTVMFLLLPYYRTRSLKRCMGHFPVWVSATATTLLLGAHGLSLTLDYDSYRVVAETSEVRSGPGESFMKLQELESGLRIRVVSEPSLGADQKSWVQVRFSEGNVGWILSDHLIQLMGRSALL